MESPTSPLLMTLAWTGAPFSAGTNPTPQILTNNYLENRLQMLLAMQDLGVQAAKMVAEQELEAAATGLK